MVTPKRAEHLHFMDNAEEVDETSRTWDLADLLLGNSKACSQLVSAATPMHSRAASAWRSSTLSRGAVRRQSDFSKSTLSESCRIVPQRGGVLLSRRLRIATYQAASKPGIEANSARKNSTNVRTFAGKWRAEA